jgi:AcrR family transcriptional regulator
MSAYYKKDYAMTVERTAARRERRIAARQKRILEAASAIFIEKGYERATTREIADAADVSEGTLYNYFTSKRDLLIGLCQEFAEETVEAILSIQAESAEDLLTRVLAGRFQHVRSRRLLTLILHQSQLDPEVHHYYVGQALARIISEAEQQIRAMTADGVTRPVNPAIAARTLVGAMMGFAILFDLKDEAIETMSSEALAGEVTDIFMNGLRVCPAGKREGVL